MAICFVIGVVEALSLLPQEIHGLSRTTGFWGLISRFNINTAGFVFVGLFLATWLAALLIWRYARTEQKWNPTPQSGTPGGAGCRGTNAVVQDADAVAPAMNRLQRTSRIDIE